MKIRITIPWHEQVLVKTEPYGTYCVQFMINAGGDQISRATVSIVAIQNPTLRKGVPQEPESALMTWDMSGCFPTQQEAIRAWENGFEVRVRDPSEAPVIEANVIHAMLHAGMAAEE